MLVPQPAAGERIAIEITSQQDLQFACDLNNARAELIDGQIEVTLANGGVLVLYGEAVKQFLAGYEEALQKAMSPAAGWSDVARFLAPAEVPSSPFFRHASHEHVHGGHHGSAGVLSATSIEGKHGSDFDTSGADSNTPVLNSLSSGPTNSAPVATNDTYKLDEDTTLTLSAPGILSNDSDADGDPLTTALVSGPAHGALTLNGDGSLTY